MSQAERTRGAYKLTQAGLTMRGIVIRGGRHNWNGAVLVGLIVGAMVIRRSVVSVGLVTTRAVFGHFVVNQGW